MVTARPKRRSAGPVTSSCSRKLTAPSDEVEGAEEPVSASASPPKRASATRLSWNAVHCVTIATRNTSAAISRRYGLAAICRIAVAEGVAATGPVRATTLRRIARVGDRDDHRGEQNQRRQHEQHVDRAADRLDQKARQQPAGDRAERRAGADQPEQPLRLPRVEQRVGEAPRLDRRNDPEAVDPDVEHRRAAARSGSVPERVPERAGR